MSEESVTAASGTERDEPLASVETEDEFLELIENKQKYVTTGYECATSDEVRRSYSSDLSNALRLQGIANDLEDGEITLEEAKRRAVDTETERDRDE